MVVLHMLEPLGLAKGNPKENVAICEGHYFDKQP